MDSVRMPPPAVTRNRDSINSAKYALKATISSTAPSEISRVSTANGREINLESDDENSLYGIESSSNTYGHRQSLSSITSKHHKHLRRLKNNLVGGYNTLKGVDSPSNDGSNQQLVLTTAFNDDTDPDLALGCADDLDHGIVDTLIENQRGWLLFGFPIFSANTLMPAVDPGPWTTANGKSIFGDASAFMLPDLTWEWVWKRWYVDMSNDVDDQGWIYSIRFGSSSWHGSHIWFHSFVRRRKWIRLRTKKQADQVNRLIRRAESLPSFDIRAVRYDENDDKTVPKDVSQLMIQLENARLDRERLNIICQFVQRQRNAIAVEAVEDYIEPVLAKFDFSDSRVKLVSRLAEIRDRAENIGGAQEQQHEDGSSDNDYGNNNNNNNNNNNDYDGGDTNDENNTNERPNNENSHSKALDHVIEFIRESNRINGYYSDNK